MNHCKKLIDFLLKDYSRNRLSFLYGAWIALFGHSFYGILWKYIYNQPHEDLNLRIICASLFLPFIFTKYLKDRNWLKVSFSAYWYFCLIINLPFIFTYLTLMNNFSGLWLICETMMISVTIILMPNLITFIIVFSFGILLAYILYLLNSHHIIDFHERIYLEYLLLMPMVIGGSILINFSSKTGEINLKVEEEKSRIFKSLAASIAHELRNPLNMINMIGFQIRNLMNDIGNIKNKNSNPSAPSNSFLKVDKNYDNDLNEFNEVNSSIKLKLIEYTLYINDAIKNANTIINAILSDINEKKINESSFSYMQPGPIIEKIVKTYGYKNKNEKSKILTILPRNPEENFILKAFPERLTYIIFNLLKNSLYYLENFPESNIIIGTEKNRTIGDKIYNTIFIYDTGPGVLPDILPKLFDDFFTFGKKDGNGLGLPFCKRNMLLIGGDITCESKFGGYDSSGKQISGWTKFSLLFPLIDKASNNLSKITSDIVEDDFKKILFIDEKDDFLLIEDGLKKNLPNLTFEFAQNFKEASRMIKSAQYQLIIIDINISKTDTIEFVKKIRSTKEDELAEIPIIAYTMMDKKSFLQIGEEFDYKDSKYRLFDSYIEKSSNHNSLYRSINKWLFSVEDTLDYIGSQESYIDSLRNKKALLADDQKINLIITKKILESVGLIVTEASSGKDLLECYKKSLDFEKKSSFDIILTDISMPPFNGDEVTKEIRKIELQNNKNNSQNNEDSSSENLSHKIPIIAITGESGKENFLHFFDCEINDYFIKGSDTEILIKIIAHYLNDK